MIRMRRRVGGGLFAVAALGAVLVGAAPAHAAGNAWSWGANSDGELGNGTITKYGGIPNAGVVSNLTGVVALAGGNAHSLALRSDGTVWAWGNGAWAQLGQGGYASSAVPLQVPGLSGVVAIAAGWAHSFALRSDGTLWAWGYNYYGQTGTGSSGNNVVSPTRVSGLVNVVAVAAGNGSFGGMALRSDGTVWTWGYDGLGQLGNGTSNESAHSTPVKVSNLTGVVDIAGGGNHALASRSDGTVWAWGSNTLGQLGVRTLTTCSTYRYPCSRLPVQVRSLSGVTDVAAGASFSLARRGDGTVWGWGDNGYGQLGNGTTSVSGGVKNPTKASLGSVIAIAAGQAHSLALRSDGTVWAAGENDLGQLGNGTFSESANPVQVTGLGGVVAIGAGQAHGLVAQHP